jgi:hypothetical protein
MRLRDRAALLLICVVIGWTIYEVVIATSGVRWNIHVADMSVVNTVIPHIPIGDAREGIVRDVSVSDGIYHRLREDRRSGTSAFELRRFRRVGSSAHLVNQGRHFSDGIFGGKRRAALAFSG